MDRARRLLAHEGATGSADEGATTPAARVYEKLHRQMAPLVGVVGVHLLFARSAKLTRGEFAAIAEVSALAPTTDVRDGSIKLREHLNGRSVDTESAAALFGNFLSLTTTFVGERLTLQILRNGWPTFEAPALREKDT